MISIVLIEPKTQGNLGAIARVMKNFEFDELILINPKCKTGKEAIKRAKHAKDILQNAKIKNINYLKNFDYIIGTTAVLGTDYNIPRSPLMPEELAKKIVKIKNSKIAILFGREDTGLTTEEIRRCDFIVNIPASKNYKTLNISHALAIILYEIFNLKNKNITKEKFIPASKKEKEQILKMVGKILDKMEFATKSKKETQKKVWKRIIGKGMLTKREAFALMGFLKKL